MLFVPTPVGVAPLPALPLSITPHHASYAVWPLMLNHFTPVDLPGFFIHLLIDLPADQKATKAKHHRSYGHQISPLCDHTVFCSEIIVTHNLIKNRPNTCRSDHLYGIDTQRVEFFFSHILDGNSKSIFPAHFTESLYQSIFLKGLTD